MADGAEETRTDLIPVYGTYDNCLAVLEQSTRVPQLLRVSDVIDAEFGAHSASTTRALMEQVVQRDSKVLAALSGYAHLLIAERMAEQQFDKDSINREIDKAEALLSYTNLGGRHPWLPRAQRMRRRINLRDYLRLGVTVIELLAVILVAGAVYNLLRTLDFSFL
jgi:hypothetical protein